MFLGSKGSIIDVKVSTNTHRMSCWWSPAGSLVSTLCLQKMMATGGCEKCWPKPTSSKRRRARRILQKASRRLPSCELLQRGAHLRALCTKTATTLKRGWPAAMDREQVATLFGVMKELAPWSAVLMLLQLFIGEPWPLWSCVGSQQGLCHVHFDYSYITTYLQKKHFILDLRKIQIKHWLKNWHRNLKYIKSILFSNKKRVPKSPSPQV